jgi:type IV pilus assembly protein PilE
VNYWQGDGRASRIKGFSLVELMVSITIVAVLTSIMLPAYQGQVRKSQRSIGRAVLLEVLARQEQFFIFNKHYADKLVLLGYAADPLIIASDGEEVAKSSTRKIYAISLENAVPDGMSQRYDLTATPQLSQSKDLLCGALMISSRGAKSSSGGATANCW